MCIFVIIYLERMWSSVWKIEIRLAELLKDRNLTQAQLAEMADMRPNAISNLVRGYVDRLSIEHIEKIVNTLGLTNINELITLVEVK